MLSRIRAGIIEITIIGSAGNAFSALLIAQVLLCVCQVLMSPSYPADTGALLHAFRIIIMIKKKRLFLQHIIQWERKPHFYFASKQYALLLNNI